MSDDFKDRLADYIPVNERLEQFHATFPDGRVITSILEHDRSEGFILMRAELFRQVDDAAPMATGHAFEERDSGYVNKTSYLENCETSAVGRALALAGYEIKRGIASREEMQKVERMNAKPAGDVPACPDCQGQMWDNRVGKRNPKAPDFKCKNKDCNGAIWEQDDAGKLTPKEAAIAGLMAQAEKLLPPDSKKLATLRGISDPDELGKKVQILVDLANKKAKVVGGAEKLKLIDAVRLDLMDDEANYLAENYDGAKLEELSIEQLAQLQQTLEQERAF